VKKEFKFNSKEEKNIAKTGPQNGTEKAELYRVVMN